MYKEYQNRIIFFTFSILHFLISGCSQVDMTITPANINPTSTSFPTPLFTNTPTPPLKDIAGLIYKLGNDLWLINETGDSQFLFTLPKDAYTFDIFLLEDNIQIVYAQNGDIWLADLQTLEEKNITNTPGRFEKAPQFWVDRPGIVVFESLLIADYSPDVIQRAGGVPTMVNTNGDNYEVIDENGAGNIIFSPDGREILYSLSEDLIAIYSWETSKIEIFDTNAYELPLGRDKSIFIQAWSPDKRFLVGRIAGYLTFGEKFQIGIAVIDLKAKTSKILHLISPKAGGDVIHYISWSPNGEWVIFTIHADPSHPDDIMNLRLSNIYTSEEIYIDKGVNPLWHQDGQRLAYDRKVKALIDGIWIYDLQTNSKYKTLLPNDAILIDWVSL